MRDKITTFQGANKRWFYRLTARNGRVIAGNQSYSRRADALRGARRLIASR
jgi:uncharacterized protein YegP (UPF0339 family)